jgi:hypothetical protein
MITKGFADNKSNEETPSLDISSREPLKNDKTGIKRVDINILKLRIEAKEKEEKKNNIIIFISFLIALGTLGIYLST